ncbi:MAG: hypothetical protein ISS45_02010 [Candidatus Omnitrophica bacterium]|nr:hypothetical protein [Candidatus Omnitrophota bacterium]
MLKNKKGMAMLIVISLILMLLILGGAVLMISGGHFGTSYHQVIKRARAYYAAKAAIQHVLWGCRTGAPSFQNLETIVAGAPRSFSHTVSDPDYSFGVDIKIYAINDLPLGVGVATPANTHPIIATVEY